MINSSKLAIVQAIICDTSGHVLHTAHGRRVLALCISSGTGMYLGRVQEFIDEMRGLDLSLLEDRQLFMNLAWSGL